MSLLLLSSIRSLAVTSLIEFRISDPDFPLQSHPDPYYNDGNSTIFTGQTMEGDVSGELSARYYDSDALRPGTNGLINSDLPWNRADPDTPQPGWLVRFGLNPDEVGVFEHTYDKGKATEGKVPASYISFKLKSAESVIYQTASLVIDNMVGVTPSEVWAVASDENFLVTRLPQATIKSDGGTKIEWDWTDLGIGDDGLEIRVYGLQGADEGYFGVGSVITTYDPPPVPEPSTSLFMGLTAMTLVTLRKRRA